MLKKFNINQSLILFLYILSQRRYPVFPIQVYQEIEVHTLTFLFILRTILIIVGSIDNIYKIKDINPIHLIT